MKYCVIRKVPYRIPGTDRIIWANVISEQNGLALLLVAKTHTEGNNSIVVAEENVSERVFVSVGSTAFEMDSAEVKRIGDRLRMLALDLLGTEFARSLEQELGL